jgi:hypothetical protein
MFDYEDDYASSNERSSFERAYMKYKWLTPKFKFCCPDPENWPNKHTNID